MEKRPNTERRANQCRASTLTWRIRYVDTSDDPRKEKHSFELAISKTYIGRTTYSSPKVNKAIPSPDDKFSVYHGDHLYMPLTLTYLGTEFTFKHPNVNTFAKEWAKGEYYACIDV
ncbi:hypothetical protein BGZ96_011633 [Linnemannia gamsii]|uniref:Uncharacterized protein n=1 Tax=Linnemannia gamsii TaxID=64522 RepID=A0ABQ7JSI0_9FUNG|nr:hypothetical protein BGZ96_011633 [Linnemannia gamsii]